MPPSPKHLRLIAPPLTFQVPQGTQMPLSLEPPARMFVVNMSMVTKHAFVGFLRQERPRVLVDVRSVPSFALGAFSRRAAFQLFEQCGVHYLDAGVFCNEATQSSVVRLAATIGKLLSEAFGNLEPDRVGLLFEAPLARTWAHLKLHEAVRPSPKSGWKLELLPQAAPSLVR